MKCFLPLACAFSLLILSCGPATKTQQVTLTPSPTATTTVTPPPSPTPTPIPIPENLLARKDVLEGNDFVFGIGEINHQDKAERVWEVIKFNADGSAVINLLDSDFHGKEVTLSSEEVAGLAVISLNAGHEQILAMKDQNTGKVTKFFLPNVDNSPDTEAAWIAPIDISQDPNNPTKVESASTFHTKLVYYSSLLGKGSEPWPEEFPSCRFTIWAGAGPAGDRKWAWSHVEVLGFDKKGNRVSDVPMARNLGFIEFNYRGNRNVVNLIQCKISDSGESMVFNYGWSGNETRNATFYSDWIPYMMLYQALNDNREFGGGVLRIMPGMKELYDTDVDNQPWLIIPDQLKWMVSLGDAQQLKSKPVLAQRYDLSDPHLLDPLEHIVIFSYL